MTGRPYKRRRVLIDVLQIQLLAITVVYFLAAAATLAAAIFGPLIWQLTQETTPVDQQWDAAAAFLTLHTRFWPALLVTFVVMAVHSVFTSHRIVGPLYRFRSVFKEIQRGNLAPWVGIRRKDLLIKEATALRDMVVSIHDRVAGIVADQQAAEAQLEALQAALSHDSMSTARSEAGKLEACLVKLAEHLDAFTLEPEEEASSG